MPADYEIVQEDTEPSFAAALSYENREIAGLEGATVKFVMRTLASNEQVPLGGTVEITNASKGEVVYRPVASDTAKPGGYMACWQVVFGSGKKMTFPTTGYQWVQVEPNLANRSALSTVVGLPEVKDYLNLPADDRTHDAKLINFIEAIGPVIEDITGPINVQVFEEWHDGGHVLIHLHHPPTTGIGTKPVLNLMAVSEYRGPIEYHLSVVGNPTEGSIYSVMLDSQMGTITRRTSGGGTTPFWHDLSHGKQSVHVVYAAGQEEVPRNVRLAALETIRVHYERTMDVGRGRRTVADELEPTGTTAFGLSREAERLLTPTRRAPAVA